MCPHRYRITALCPMCRLQIPDEEKLRGRQLSECILTTSELRNVDLLRAPSAMAAFHRIIEQVKWTGYACGLRQVGVTKTHSQDLQLPIVSRMIVHWLPDEQRTVVPGWDADGAPCWEFPKPKDIREP
jgi:hypothetical protein